MPSDLREFLACVSGTMGMALIAVMLVAFVTLPSSLHHHIGSQPNDAAFPTTHLT
jgi:hypothetical protein